ncbi:hypothetical protein ACFQ23_11615 [Schaalia naturae]|uniref:DUF4352 domain-containing protein n=1 Tax=Schaalia naturae TaxID=635203 RepID=A0ABW2SPL8_9ACTO
MPRWSLPASAATTVVILAGLALGSAIDRAVPSSGDVLDEPFVHEVVLGQTARLRTGAVTPVAVRTARSIQWYGETYGTAGTWVVLTMDVEAAGKPRVFAGFEAHGASGRTYADAVGPTGCSTAQPGVPLECTVAFEVASDDVAGLVVGIPAEGVPGSPSDDLAMVDLGLDEDDPLVRAPEDLVSVTEAAVPGGEQS